MFSFDQNLSIVFLVLVGLIVLGIFIRYLSRQNAPKPLEYHAIPLLTETEIHFYQHLIQIYDHSTVICPKVRLEDLIHANQTTNRSAKQSARNRISSRHVDFVLLSREDFSVLGIVELDDKSHTRTSRIARDIFLNEALRQACLPLSRIKVRSRYSPDALRTQINSDLKLNL